MSGRVLGGGCLCGAVRYEVPDAFEYALMCHCSRCRRATGSAFKPFGGLPASGLRIVRGEAGVMRHGGAVEHDARCGTCGALLWSAVRGGAYVHLAYGSLSDAPGRAPEAHIFTGSMASWHVIADGLPRYEALP